MIKWDLSQGCKEFRITETPNMESETNTWMAPSRGQYGEQENKRERRVLASDLNWRRHGSDAWAGSRARPNVAEGAEVIALGRDEEQVGDVPMNMWTTHNAIKSKRRTPLLDVIVLSGLVPVSLRVKRLMQNALKQTMRPSWKAVLQSKNEWLSD